MLYFWDTDNTTIYSTWNDLEGDSTFQQSYRLVDCSHHESILYRFWDIQVMV